MGVVKLAGLDIWVCLLLNRISFLSVSAIPPFLLATCKHTNGRFREGQRWHMTPLTSINYIHETCVCLACTPSVVVLSYSQLISNGEQNTSEVNLITLGSALVVALQLDTFHRTSVKSWRLAAYSNIRCSIALLDMNQ